MYEVGEALGLERGDAGSLAEALFIEEMRAKLTALIAS
jgi:hypothetical protein